MLSFKTLSHLGEEYLNEPSKPCHIWAELYLSAFKTLSHLGFCVCILPSKPCHIWGWQMSTNLQNPVTSGARSDALAFKTLSHLGDYHKSFVVHRKFGVKRM